MPFISEDSAADRSLGVTTNMHPRLNGDLILTPFDTLEGLGNFTEVDGDGNPNGWTLGQPEKPNGRHVYIGLSPDTTTRQTHRSLAYDRPSHLVNYTLLESQPPPSPSTPLLAQIPTPPKPILAAESVSVVGYTASSTKSPHWIAWAYVLPDGRMTQIGPPTSFQLAQGQSAEVLIPQDVPEGIYELALFMSEPGTSRPTSPGPMRVQRVLDLRQYFSPTYALTGPYRTNGALAPIKNDTAVPDPVKPHISNILGQYACKVGKYYAKITWTDAQGETLASETTNPIEIVFQPRWSLRNQQGQYVYFAGVGKIIVERPPTPPKGATGWRCYLYIVPSGTFKSLLGYQAGWHRVFNRKTQQGDTTPFPLSEKYVYTSGWTGQEQYYAGNDVYICVPSELPQANTTGLKPPTTKPEPPVVVGAARPAPATYHVRVTDVVDGVESLPSEAASLSISSEQVLSVIFQNHENRIPNHTFVERGPDNLPLHWTLATNSNGWFSPEAAELWMGTNAAGATSPHAITKPIPINPTKTGYIRGSIAVEPPNAGAMAGNVEVVLEQIDAHKQKRRTILKQVSAPGIYEYEVEVTPVATATPLDPGSAPSTEPAIITNALGTAAAWDARSETASIMIRGSGASQHFYTAIRETILRDASHKPRRETPLPSVPVRLRQGYNPATTLAEQSTTKLDPLPVTSPAKTAIIDPPEPPWVPLTNVVPDIDRPKSLGTVLENLTFENGTFKTPHKNILTRNQATVDTDTTGFNPVSTTIARDTSRYEESPASLSVTATVSDNGDKYVSIPTLSSKVSTAYSWSIRVYVSVATRISGGGFYLQETGGLSRSIATEPGGSRILQPGWQTLQGSGTTPADWHTGMHLVIRPARNDADSAYDATKTIWFDKFQVEEAAAPTAWEAPTDAWVSETLGNATVAIAAAAAIEGTQGVRFKSPTAGDTAQSAATIRQQLETSKHMGIYAKMRVAEWPAGGRIFLNPITNADASVWNAWLEASSTTEQAKLKILEAPLVPGNVSVYLDGVATNIAVSSTAEVADLTISAAPTGPGSVTVNLDGKPYHVPVGGTPEKATLHVNDIPATDGWISVSVDGQQRDLYVTRYTGKYRTGFGSTARWVYTNNTTDAIASQIKNAGWPGFRVEQSGSYLYFTAELPGTRQDAWISVGSTGMSASFTTTQQGANETAAQLAARIRQTAFPGWNTSQGATTQVIRFTAQIGGPRADITYAPGVTGASGSVSTVTQGTIDTKEDLALRIRNTVFTNWTISGSGDEVIFTHNSAGVRQAAGFFGGSTGTRGTMYTVRQGSNGAINAVVQDTAGTRYVRKIMDGLSTTSVFNVDISVNGAETDRACVHFFGSLGAAPLELLARFEDLNMWDMPARRGYAGVYGESSNGLTWEVHMDNVKQTDRGISFFREHTESGEWINQVVGYYQPSQPIRQDLMLQDGYAPVKPGRTYTVAGFVRADNENTTPIRPLTVTALEADVARTHYMGDIAGENGLIKGKTAWAEKTLTFTVPDNCHVIKLASRDIGGAEVVMQEVVCSPGSTPNRSGRYQESGSHVSNIDIRTPEGRSPYMFWTRERTTLGAFTEFAAADSTNITTTYKSAPPSASDPDQPGTYSVPTTDPETVPDNPFIEVTFQATGPGTKTPIIKTGSPYTEVALKVSKNKRMSTLLAPDHTELIGGSCFAVLESWANRPPQGRRRLPSGRLHNDPQLFPPVGVLPAAELLVFNEKTKRYLEENWLEDFPCEMFGKEVAVIRLAEPPIFKKDTPHVLETPDGSRHSVWKAKLAPSEVTLSSPLPQ